MLEALKLNLLALETSTDPGSVALWHDRQLLARSCPPGQSNSETLLPLAAALLREAGLVFADLDAIAFASGPGSFTGLRVACGVAQGLAFAHALPLVPVGTLAAMALESGSERVVVVLDARMGEVYHGVFVNGERRGEIGVYPPESVPLPESGAWLACGNGIAAYPLLRERLSPYVNAWKAELMPSAEAVARLAASAFARGERVDAADAVPIYVRDKVAKTVLERLALGGKA